MSIKQPAWRALTLSLILITTLSCVFLPTGKQIPRSTSTPTQTATAFSSTGGGGDGSGGTGGGSGQGGNGGGNGQGGTGGINTIISTPVPTTNATPPVFTSPYVVKQVESLGHESISGQVCDLTKTFIVGAVAPEVAWDFMFSPLSTERGNWTYAYSIPKAGESHSAAGSYKVTLAANDGTLLLTMKGSDHVVFKGFDGSLPVIYKFDLVPSSTINCPGTH